MGAVKAFEWDENSIKLYYADSLIWSIERSKIAVIAISEVMNGDVDTTIFTIIDVESNVIHLDMAGLKTDHIRPTYNFFCDSYDLNDLEEDSRDTTVVFYPESLRGIYPYNKSILTKVIRFAFNGGGGRLNNQIKNFLASYKGV